jgi:hypothetical protein
MDEKNEKAAKKYFPRAALWAWCGGGLFWRLLNRIFLRPCRFGCKVKSTGPKRGPCLASPPTPFCGRKQKPPGRLNGGNSPQNGHFHPKRGH